MKNGFYRRLDGRLFIDATPGDVLDYTLDYIEEFKSAESISSSGWSVPPGVAKLDDGFDGQRATVWLDAATAGQSFAVTNTVTTNHGRTFARTFWLNVVDALS